MRYLFIPKAEAVTYLSCGQLIRNKNFLHPKRCLDSYVLIVIVDGSLNIVQDNTSYILGPNQFLLLHANTLHYGWQESADYLQYYWTHFHVPDDSFYITAPDSSTASYLQSVQANPDKYVLPETGTLKHSNRVLLLFSQLLDLSMRRYPVSDYLLRYFQTALLMELAGEFTVSEDTDSSMEIFRIQDWILHHYAQTITVSQIAEIFHYNSAYLSSLYKKTTGVPLKQYINHVRIDAAKKMLISSDSSLKEIAFRCGYTDKKYFFKVFKQLENMTPAEYREAFYKKKSTN